MYSKERAQRTSMLNCRGWQLCFRCRGGRKQNALLYGCMYIRKRLNLRLLGGVDVLAPYITRLKMHSRFGLQATKKAIGSYVCPLHCCSPRPQTLLSRCRTHCCHYWMRPLGVSPPTLPQELAASLVQFQKGAMPEPRTEKHATRVGGIVPCCIYLVQSRHMNAHMLDGILP